MGASVAIETSGRPPERLTQGRLDRALRGERPKSGILRDHEVRGFYVRINAASVSYWFEYKPRGIDAATSRRHKTRHELIGNSATHALAEAREVARNLYRRVRQGGDPKAEDAEARVSAEAERQRQAAATRVRVGCAGRLDAYAQVLATRGTGDKHQAEEVRQTRLALASIDALDLTPGELTVPLIEKMLGLCSPGTRAARFGALHRFLTWALKGTGSVSPTLLFDRYERPRPPPSRRRVLTGAELTAIWRAAQKLPNAVITDLVHFVIAIPCRRGEVASVRWRDLDTATKVWHQPTSKNQDPHDFPLNERALAILVRRREATGGHPDDFVFPGPRHAKPFCGWSNLIDAIADRICEDTPVAPGWRLHDVRRSFVTHLADAGHDEILLDLTINHRASRSRSGVRGVYQRAIRWPERVAALSAWNGHLDRALGENIRPLRRMG
jgi:integrase